MRNAPPPTAPASHDLSSSPPSATRNGSGSHPALSTECDAARRKLLRILPRELVLDLDGAIDVDTESIAFVSSALYRVIKRTWPAGKVSIGYCVRPNMADAGGEKDKGRDEGKGKDEAGAAGAMTGAKRTDVRVREAKGVPRGHIWVGEKVRKDLGLADGAAGFELLRFVRLFPSITVLVFSVCGLYDLG